MVRIPEDRMRVAQLMINAAVHYGCLAMLDLAVHGRNGEPVSTSDIISRNGIPGPFLLQILRSLKSTGWVGAVRGSRGGYQLRVDPDKITLLDIVEAIGTGEDCEPTGCRDAVGQEVLRQCWGDAMQRYRGHLAKVRLGDLVRQCQDCQESMFYI